MKGKKSIDLKYSEIMGNTKNNIQSKSVDSRYKEQNISDSNKEHMMMGQIGGTKSESVQRLSQPWKGEAQATTSALTLFPTTVGGSDSSSRDDGCSYRCRFHLLVLGRDPKITVRDYRTGEGDAMFVPR